MTALENLKQYFGYDDFRDGQETLINDILAGKDVLGIMPTGAGKSVCFQIPALMMSGITLIISPLISLMKDQVNALTQSGIAAAFINSSLNERQIQKALYNAANRTYKLIYVAPERLMSHDFLLFAQSAQISMLTVDEAHCISQWGQDFRPSYTKIPEFVAQLRGKPIVSAFTATATSAVREDIISQLALRSPTVLVSGFDRQNLYFGVRKPGDKFAELLEILHNKQDKSGIIYCSTRKTVEEACNGLNGCGYKASRYHAGLSDSERHSNQEDFIYDRVQIMVATNAFGMGIDKSNVSYVVHYNMPKDMEAYYQEAGRAGRDGEHADCILLYSGQDVHTNKWLIQHDKGVEYPSEEIELLLKGRALNRLRDITFYCTTKNCLRGYILKYFGEKPPNRCNNCSSCNPIFTPDSYNYPEIKTPKREIKQPVLNSVDNKLLAHLKELRLNIANIQSTPAYTIFHDSTLTDMCMKLPKTMDELLKVSGVGKVKAEQYGERFLKSIAEFLSENILNDVSKNDSQVSVFKDFDTSRIELSEEAVTVSAVADRINCVLIESGYTKITGQKINAWLLAGGYIENIEINGKHFKISTHKGLELGIITEERVIRGENAQINLFNSAAQKYITANALEILNFKPD